MGFCVALGDLENGNKNRGRGNIQSVTETDFGFSHSGTAVP
jgi:hypothetical protein